MAAGTRQSNTMDEILRKQLSMFADLKLADDADFDWIAEQEAKIIERLRGPQDRANAMMQAQGSTAVTPQMGGPIGGAAPQAAPAQDPNVAMLMQAIAAQQGGGMPVPNAAGAVPGAMPPGRGPTPTAPMPNPDELRRVMDQGQGI
jgi:hypothetical protein